MADDTPPPSDSDAESSASPGRSPEPVDMLRPLFREEPLPPEGGEPPQMWLWILIFGVLLFSTFYLGVFIGDFSPDPWLQSPEPVAQRAGPPEPEPVSGSQVYSARCASCHQSNGQGVSGAFPTLVNTSWVENKGQIIRILLHGMQGEVVVKGETYNGNMPAWGTILSDREIAAVITHVRQAWANDYGDVTAEEVAAVRSATEGRADPWSPEELQQSGNQAVPSGDNAAADAQTVGRVLYDRLVARAAPPRSAGAPR
jgi:mono/diheme cytochrome c family protein